MPPRIPSPAVVRAVEARAGVAVAASRSWTLSQQSAGFSSTPSCEVFSKARRNFRQWLKTDGVYFKKAPEDGPRYIASSGRKKRAYKDGEFDRLQPFPTNSSFKTAPVLSEKARQIIWEKVMRDGETIKAVSAEYGVDVRRVAAVIRLQEVERDWEKKGKFLAKPYAKAVLGMLRTHKIYTNSQNKPLEDINEVHIHPHTMQQIFWPTAESRHFTRKDAAKVFNKDMLPLDERVQIPELIQLEKDISSGIAPYEAAQKFKSTVRNSETKTAEKARAAAAAAESAITRVRTERFDMRFQDYNAEQVGKDGRHRNAIGARYGVPHYDRAKGQVKIPTSVP
ncbi:eukaryotic mitochondrial regulator protein-domain-containing protein [Microdochium trichocladiopsis]|uniref:Eukaryotic mitochondrial regulator protein-domain-containing protein n=1 Tax=Microdochium trichocladiopsis TaxID=1682393 RepID=A0A9P8Y4X5_9PEZI|nr:eukaryotic mitochondrial regulator protein-domain-containing protein [Microdochium trichocladiopsis]KAH7029434.1 eukaryotic mitochondrial regulator protein-domain-containing protein [Microdochium trichocladiopsis]